MPATLRSLEQALDLRFIQEVLAALVRVGRSGRHDRDTPPHPLSGATLYTSPLGRTLSTLEKPASHIGSGYHTLYEKRLLFKVLDGRYYRSSP